MTKNKVISEISPVLVPANMFLVPANNCLQKSTGFSNCGLVVL